jgi:hypothetical protein
MGWKNTAQTLYVPLEIINHQSSMTSHQSSAARRCALLRGVWGEHKQELVKGLTRPDGTVRLDGFNDFGDVGPHSNPSRSQMESFVKMWQRVMRAIDVVPTGPLTDLSTFLSNANANGVRSQSPGLARSAYPG